jgi:hypothetical protein
MTTKKKNSNNSKTDSEIPFEDDKKKDTVNQGAACSGVWR